ncbi:MAG: hypothetical protein HC844_10800 [Tabrizicola sp.]|nr:hypothetical protein [Tabrizicola sp.]
MTTDKVHPEQRAIYREKARRIVSADRAARKYGLSQNTIGEIERALVAAWQDGCRQGGMIVKEEVATAPTWLQVPARSRTTLESLTFWFSKRHGHTEDRADRIECFEAGGKPRWRRIDADGQRDVHSVADGSVRPLVRLGLLASCAEAPDIYSLTETGLKLCRDYWARSDMDDPDLPRLSLR